MKILICGDRNWKNEQLVHYVLSQYPKDTVVMHGGAKGADVLAGRIARKLGLKVYTFPANWEKFGKRAGILRNIEMIKTKPDLVVAFHNDLNKSKGTKDTLLRADKEGIPYEIYSEIEGEKHDDKRER